MTEVIPFIAIFALFYFLVLLPQNREQQEREQMLKSLQRDDRIVTTSGLHGRIVEVRPDGTVVVDTGGAKLVFERTAVQRRVTDGNASDKK